MHQVPHWVFGDWRCWDISFISYTLIHQYGLWGLGAICFLLSWLRRSHHKHWTWCQVIYACVWIQGLSIFWWGCPWPFGSVLAVTVQLLVWGRLMLCPPCHPILPACRDLIRGAFLVQTLASIVLFSSVWPACLHSMLNNWILGELLSLMFAFAPRARGPPIIWLE